MSVRRTLCSSSPRRRGFSTHDAGQRDNSTYGTARVTSSSEPFLHPTPAAEDQAATLRRLFARRQARVLPVWVSPARDAQLALWLAKLAQAFAQAGERTLVIDAARVHVSAALGLRARHDLAHVLTGECTVTDVLLDAAPGLHVVPAARAFDAAAPTARGHGPHLKALARALPHLAARAESDRVLVLFSSAHASLLPAGCDCVVPVHGASARHLVRDVRGLDARADIAGFRLLFLDMNPELVTTLDSKLSALAGTLGKRLQTGGHARVGRDLVHVVRAACGWRSAPLATDAMEHMV